MLEKYGRSWNDLIIMLFKAHFIHRNLKHPNLETALKQPNGVHSIAVFLNVRRQRLCVQSHADSFQETHGNNHSLQALIDALPSVRYKGSESALGSFPVTSLLPGNGKFTFRVQAGRRPQVFREEQRVLDLRRI